jgi:hypothetical protein
VKYERKAFGTNDVASKYSEVIISCSDFHISTSLIDKRLLAEWRFGAHLNR